DRECSEHGTLSIIAVSDRRAKYTHDAVADVLVDAAPMVLNDAIDALEEASGQGMYYLKVEFIAKLCVAAKVGEQHHHLPPLALCLGRGCQNLPRARRDIRSRPRAQCGDGVKQNPTISNRGHAEVLQILGRQPR